MTNIYILAESPTQMMVLLEDGGIAEIYAGEETIITNYFQSRLTSDDMRIAALREKVLEDSKMYVKEWNENFKFITQEMIHDAVNWLDVGFPVKYSDVVFINSYEDMADIIEATETKLYDPDFESKFRVEYSMVEREIDSFRLMCSESETKADQQNVRLFRHMGECYAHLRMLDKQWVAYKEKMKSKI